MTTFIHVGAPKTATTYIQGLLDLNRGELKEQDYKIILPKGVRGTPCYQYHAAQHMGFNSNVTFEEAKKNFNNLISGPMQYKIISEEGFTHDLMPSDRTKGRFGGVPEAVESLYQLTDGDATIVLTIRSQDSFLDSCYKHKIKWQGATIDYSEYFFNSVDIFSLSWASVIDAFERRFSGRIRVVPFELVKLGEQQFIKAFLAACEIEDIQKFVWEVPENFKNESMSSAEAKVMLELNRVLGKSIMGEGKRFKVINMIEEIVGGGEDKKFREALPEHWKSRIRSLYAQENISILQSKCNCVPQRIFDMYSQ